MTMKFGTKEWFLCIISMLLLTDIIIFLNIPIVRQVLAFLCFTTIPGLLILRILKLNKIRFLKKFVLSIGLSIAFLMFVGLILNQLYFAIGISKPLSTPSLVISFTFILVILAFIAYRNKDDLDFPDVFNIRFDLKKEQVLSPVFFPLVFPFLAVFGTYLMNTEGNNIILMIMLFSIPAYIVFVVYLRNRIPKITYPVAILAIATALLLMHGLTSYYLNGRDIYLEYHAFRVVGNYLHWSMSNYHHVLTSCLSVSLLPTIYRSLVDINELYVYKALYQVIGAITPLVCYVIFKKYVDELYAFLASVFFMAQISFIYGAQSALRTELAILFVALAMMVFFSDEINILKKRILFLIFIFAVIVSHYATSYIFFFMILAFWLVTMPSKNPFTFKSEYRVTTTVVVIFFAVIFFWYSQVTALSFTDFTLYANNIFINLFNFFEEDLRDQALVSQLTGQVDILPHRITIVVQWVTFIFMIIGIMDLIRDYKNKKLNFELEYLLMLLISGVIIVLTIILPYLSTHYGANRIYQQCLVLLAFTFVIGGAAICKYAHRPKFSLVIITIVLISQFFCATYVVHQVLGVPYSEDLNREGRLYNKFYITDQEVIGAKWLCEHRAGNPIYGDRKGWENGAFIFGCEGVYPCEIGGRIIRQGYIYLRRENVISGVVYIEKNKIYGNGGSEIYA